MKTADVNYASKMLTAISQLTRLRIVMALSAKAYHSVEEIAEDCEQSLSSTSAHLKTLRSVEVVQVEKKGRQHVYSLSKAVFDGKQFTFGPVMLQLAEKPVKAPKPAKVSKKA